MPKVLVIGGGAAGMMAAIAAAESGAEVELFEKNEKLGKKLFITGKGRCNVTNACDRDAFFKNVTVNPRFLFSSFGSFDNVAVMDFFEKAGLSLKTERGMRVFPTSDKSSDVIKALKDELDRLGVKVHLNSEVREIKTGDRIQLKLSNGHAVGDSVIVATGGKSYKSTGSTGDGYIFAREMGHTVTPLMPSLAALETKEEFPKRLMGVSLKNVTLTLENEKGKKIYSELGEMLFTHFGISGPLVLSASTFISEAMRYDKPVPQLYVDLKPALSNEELDTRILKDFSSIQNKCFRNALDGLLPQSMVAEMVALSGIDPEKKVNSITKEERANLVKCFKHLEFTVTGLRSFDEAIITKGGVNIKEINPKTMESKICPNVYFAGEVLDLDAMTGGFNLQIAWSTGYTAGISAGETGEY